MELRENFEIDRLSHAYVSSPSLVSIFAMAAVCSGMGDKRPCGQCINCKKVERGIHPDIIHVRKLDDKKDIVVDQIRALKRNAIEVPNDASKKVYIIEQAELMNTNAQNAFLQLLEEPPIHAMFILSTDTPIALLPTVRSRCAQIRSMPQPQEDEEDDIAEKMAGELFSSLKRGNSALVDYMFRLEKLEKEKFSKFLLAARKRAAAGFRDSSAKDGIMSRTLIDAEQILTKAVDMLDLNVSIGHIAGLICATLIADEDN